jgi:hypothetical protein
MLFVAFRAIYRQFFARHKIQSGLATAVTADGAASFARGFPYLVESGVDTCLTKHRFLFVAFFSEKLQFFGGNGLFEATRVADEQCFFR